MQCFAETYCEGSQSLQITLYPQHAVLCWDILWGKSEFANHPLVLCHSMQCFAETYCEGSQSLQITLYPQHAVLCWDILWEKSEFANHPQPTACSALLRHIVREVRVCKSPSTHSMQCFAETYCERSQSLQITLYPQHAVLCWDILWEKSEFANHPQPTACSALLRHILREVRVCKSPSTHSMQCFAEIYSEGSQSLQITLYPQHAVFCLDIFWGKSEFANHPQPTACSVLLRHIMREVRVCKSPSTHSMQILLRHILREVRVCKSPSTHSR